MIKLIREFSTSKTISAVVIASGKSDEFLFKIIDSVNRQYVSFSEKFLIFDSISKYLEVFNNSKNRKKILNWQISITGTVKTDSCYIKITEYELEKSFVLESLGGK